jgi:twitching motility protein PilT
VGSPPAYRIDGILHPAELTPLSPEDTRSLLDSLLPDGFKDEIDEVPDIDFAYGRAGLGRFRVNAYHQRGSVNIVVRSVAATARSLAELGLPTAVVSVLDEPTGLIIVTGPTGSGKTTTCAAMIDHINESRRNTIITIEDPIEVLHRDKKSIVSQREVGVDTPSYADGVKAALRQDPDVIYIGEMRDRDTIEAALVAAETGHLVVATMYTLDAMETVRRILDTFPPYLERRTRQMLATTLRAVVSQRLIPMADGHGRTVIAELLVNTEAVPEKLIDPDQTADIFEVMEEGAFYGMQTIDQAITKKYESGDISFSDALMFVSEPRDFKIAAGVGHVAAS